MFNLILALLALTNATCSMYQYEVNGGCCDITQANNGVECYPCESGPNECLVCADAIEGYTNQTETFSNLCVLCKSLDSACANCTNFNECANYTGNFCLVPCKTACQYVLNPHCDECSIENATEFDFTNATCYHCNAGELIDNNCVSCSEYKGKNHGKIDSLKQCQIVL